MDVVPYGIEEAFAPREHWPEAEMERVLERFDAPERFVLYVGRLNARKNVAALVRAVAHFTTPDLKLLVVGAADGTAEDSGDRRRDARRRAIACVFSARWATPSFACSTRPRPYSAFPRSTKGLGSVPSRRWRPERRRSCRTRP